MGSFRFCGPRPRVTSGREPGNQRAHTRSVCTRVPAYAVGCPWFHAMSEGTGVAMEASRRMPMAMLTENTARVETESADVALENLLDGYRFTVCQTPEAMAEALDVRNRVYNDGSGYGIPVPDEYDHRSWLLLATDLETGK